MSIPQSPYKGQRAFRQKDGLTSRRSWMGAVILAILLHFGVWWVPVSLPAVQREQTRTVRIKIFKPPPPRRKPKIKPPPKVRKPKPRRRRVRRKRRYRRKKRRRIKRKRRKPIKRRITPKPIVRKVTKPKRVAMRQPDPPRPVAPAPRAPAKRPVRQASPGKRVNMRGYGMGVYRSILRHKRYPLMAYKMRFEGIVILSIRIAKTGKLLGKPRIVRSSGHSILDREAVRMVLAAAPMRPIPSGYSRPYATFRVPVKFRITQ